MKTATVCVLPFVFAIVTACDRPGAGESPATASAPTPVACGDLAKLVLPNATISSAELVPAGTFVPLGSTPPQLSVRPDYTKLPAFCRVATSLHPTADSDIRFELWMPVAGWNGKFMGTGNGGAAGAIFYWNMVEPLIRGYAVANTDTGHQGTIDDRSFAMGHPEKYDDFGWRAVHEMTVTSKAMISAHYGAEAQRAYWSGCSTGGRQGLKEVQRFPDDYDGVIAGAPAANVTGQVSFSILVQTLLTGANAPLPAAKLPLLKEAALAACDANDGVTDRVIVEPAQCTFDPAAAQCKTTTDATTCLTPDEVNAARRLYGGVVNSRTGERVYPGASVAGEPGTAPFASNFSIGTSHMRYAVLEDPNWDPFSFDFNSDIERIRVADDGRSAAMDPDISAFVARGGKLLLYHGTTDGLAPFQNTVGYYRSVEDKLGEELVREHMRLFLVPGMDHCRGGDGAQDIDYIGALEQWVEQGVVPDRLLARRPPAAAQFTRPVCAHPSVPLYKGDGDAADAANWLCVAR
jgi:feruloyl esterase